MINRCHIMFPDSRTDLNDDACASLPSVIDKWLTMFDRY